MVTWLSFNKKRVQYKGISRIEVKSTWNLIEGREVRLPWLSIFSCTQSSIICFVGVRIIVEKRKAIHFEYEFQSTSLDERDLLPNSILLFFFNSILLGKEIY